MSLMTLRQVRSEPPRPSQAAATAPWPDTHPFAHHLASAGQSASASASIHSHQGIRATDAAASCPALSLSVVVVVILAKERTETQKFVPHRNLASGVSHSPKWHLRRHLRNSDRRPAFSSAGGSANLPFSRRLPEGLGHYRHSLVVSRQSQYEKSVVCALQLFALGTLSSYSVTPLQMHLEKTCFTLT